MNHRVGVVDQFGDKLAILDVVEVILHPVERLEVPDVVHAARGKIVEQDDVVAAIEQALRKMRTNEAGAAGNQKSQNSSKRGQE
jgi:hypothetical protein